MKNLTIAGLISKNFFLQILSDFREMYPNHCDNLFKNWNRFCEQVKEALIKKKTKNISQYMEQLDEPGINIT